MPRTRRAAGHRQALIAALLFTVAAVAAPAHLAAPAHGAATGSPATAADWGAAWLADLVSPEGYVGGPDMTTSGSITVYTGLALAAADVERPAFDRVVTWMRAHHQEFISDGGGVPRPGAAGQVALLAVAAGADPRDFGGSDLVAQIQLGQTPAGADAGMYGVVNTSAAVFLHSFAMLGLRAAGVPPSVQAVTWLLGQQCPDGSWPAYRSATHRAQGTCATTNPGNAEGDATAMAIQALVAEGRLPADAADGLRLLQTATGGFAFSRGSSANANSSGLAVQAIAAMDQDPAGEAWRQAQGTAVSALLDFQVGCDHATVEHRGGFRYLSTSSRPDSLSTSQAVWGVAARAFPLRSAPANLDAVVCGPNVTPLPASSSSSTPTPSMSATPTPTPTPSQTPTSEPSSSMQVERVSGDDRYASAVEVSREAFPSGVPVVYLATGAGFADALAAGPAAAAQRGAVLLTAPDALPAVVAEEIRRLQPERVVALGGPAVISDAVLDEVSRAAPTGRIRGTDRYATAAAVSQVVFSPGSRRVLVATGANFPDALAGIGAAPDGPILLVTPDAVPEATAQELRRLGPLEVLVLGGPVAVSDATVAELARIVGGEVRRVAGTSRYETAALLLREGVHEAAVLYVATGERFPDALAAAAAAGAHDTGILLVTRDTVPDVVRKEIGRVRPLRILVLGGTASVSDEVLAELRRS